LEKSFTWQPHVRYDIGMDLDLIDRESLMVNAGDNHALSRKDLTYITSAGTGGSTRVDGTLSDGSKPTWLRTTTYTENQIMDVSILNEATGNDRNKRLSGGGESDDEAAGARGTGDGDGEKRTTKRKRVEADSFDEVNKTVQKLRKAAKSPRGIEFVSALVPEPTQWCKVSTLLKFDEDPYVGSGGDVDVQSGIITNFNALDNKGSQWSSSLVAPKNGSAPGAMGQYGWVRDLELSLHARPVEGAYAVGVNASGPSMFYPVRFRLDLKKYLPSDVTHEHESTVVRRQLSDEEKDAAKALADEITAGGE